jgi:hypothetical protein
MSLALPLPSSPGPLMRACPTCEGCGQICDGDPRDPNVRSWRCGDCEGEGEIVAVCTGCGKRQAVVIFGIDKFCAECASN